MEDVNIIWAERENYEMNWTAFCRKEKKK